MNNLTQSDSTVTGNRSLNLAIFYIVEPVPDWKKAYKVWGWIWYFYVYGFSILFLVICGISSLVLFHLLLRYRCQKYVGILTLVCVCLLGLFNSCYLLFDPRSQSVVSLPVLHHFLRCLTSPMVVSIFFLYSKFLVRLTKYELNRYGRFHDDPKRNLRRFACNKLTIAQICLLSAFYSSVLALNWLDIYSEAKEHRYWHACTKGVFITWCLIASFSIFHESCVLAHYAEKSRKILSILQRRKSRCSAQFLRALQTPLSSNSDLSFLKYYDRAEVLANGSRDFAEKRMKMLKRNRKLKAYRNLTFKATENNSSAEEQTSESDKTFSTDIKMEKPNEKRRSMGELALNEAENTFCSDRAGLLTVSLTDKNEFSHPLLAKSKEEIWLQMSTLNVKQIKRKGMRLVDQLRSMKSNLSEHRGSRATRNKKKYLLEALDQSSTESDRLSERHSESDGDELNGTRNNPEERPVEQHPGLISHSISALDVLSRRSNDYEDGCFDNFSEGYSADDDESRKTSIGQNSKKHQGRVSSLPCCVSREKQFLRPKLQSLSSDHLPSLDFPKHQMSLSPQFAQRISLTNLRMSKTYKKISRGSYFIAMIGFCSSFANIYGLFGVFGVFSNVPEADAWPWLAFQAILK